MDTGVRLNTFMLSSSPTNCTGVTVVLIRDFFFFMVTLSWRAEHSIIALELRYVRIVGEMHGGP